MNNSSNQQSTEVFETQTKSSSTQVTNPETSTLPKKKGKKIILALVLLLLFGGIGGGSYYIYNSLFYFTTNNAKVYTELETVVPTSTGRLIRWNVDVGSNVHKNEVIGRLQNGSYLRSPIDGQVVDTEVLLNETVSPATSVATIANISDIRIDANIEESDIGKIALDDDVDIELDAYPNQVFKGHVSQIKQVSQQRLSGQTTSFSTSGTYTKVVQLIPIEVTFDDSANLSQIIGTNATIKIRIRN